MARWSVSLGRIAGTEVRVHFTFLLLVLWFGLAAGMQAGAAASVDAIVFILSVFGCVMLHEYGHVLTAKSFGIATKDITLLPIGGIASVERMPEKPAQELLVALAGPAVNGLIAAFLIVLFGADIGAEMTAASMDDLKLDFATRLALVNVMLGLFNLIPAFPMDGGRVLRALLSLRLDRVQATRIAARIGHAIALGLGFLGLFGNFILVFIALFIFLAASQEAYATELGEAAREAGVSAATITAFSTLDMQSTVSQGVDKLLSSSQRDFPVTDGAGRLRGVLTREAIIRALTDRGPDTPVIDVMERSVVTVDRHATLTEAVAKLQGGQPLVGVVDDDGRLVGLVTLENLAEYMMVIQATGRHHPHDGVATTAPRKAAAEASLPFVALDGTFALGASALTWLNGLRAPVAQPVGSPMRANMTPPASLMVRLAAGAPNGTLLQLTADLANRLKVSKVIGISACQPVQIYGSPEAYVPPALINLDREQIDSELKAAEKDFRAALEGKVAVVEWRSTVVTYGSIPDYVVGEMRAADLLVTASQETDSPLDRSRCADIADMILRAGRPVLVAAPSESKLDLQSVVIGWKETREARRAVQDALPLLLLAERVVVVEIAGVEGLADACTRTADVAGWLTSHGVRASTRVVAAAAREAAQLRDIVSDFDLDAGLVVGGAYGHTRLREWVLGGVTKDLLLQPVRCSLVSH